MSFLQSPTPFPIQIIPRQLDWWTYAIVVGFLFAFGIFLYLAVHYQPKQITLKIQKIPDNTYLLKYDFSWYSLGASIKRQFASKEELEAKIDMILDECEL